eukprot:evm.model.scf_394.5 EVM.evm.TU.scf_394.5   scf_394:44626-49197(-)
MAGEGGAYAASLETIQEARIRIGPHAHVTPILTCQSLDNLAGRALFFKCEAFQKGGAFKFRGACNAVFSLPEDQAAKGVVTHRCHQVFFDAANYCSQRLAGCAAQGITVEPWRWLQSFVVYLHTLWYRRRLRTAKWMQ